MKVKRIVLLSIGIAVGFQLVLLLAGIAWYWLLTSSDGIVLQLMAR